MNTTVLQLDITEGKQIDLVCSLDPAPLDPTFRYSLIWTFERQDENETKFDLLTYSHDGRLQFLSQDPDFRNRLHFSRPTAETFNLSVLNSVHSHSGRYYCRGDQFKVDCKGKMELKGSARSDFTHVNVHLIGKYYMFYYCNYSIHKYTRIPSQTQEVHGVLGLFTLGSNPGHSCPEFTSM